MARADDAGETLRIKFYQARAAPRRARRRRRCDAASRRPPPPPPTARRPPAQVDAFAAAPFEGNPAAVCLLPRRALPLADDARLAIAAENNLSETAFVECGDGGDNFAECARFRLRWFTPAVEVPLCGHATLAAAAALFLGERNAAPAVTFETASGELAVARAPGGAFQMDLPALPAAAALPGAFGVGSEVVHALVGELPVEEVLFCAELKYLLVVLCAGPGASRAAFEGLAPDSARLRAVGSGELVGACVTLRGDAQAEWGAAAADAGAGAPPDAADTSASATSAAHPPTHHFYLRFFAPWAGIAEDPVTGSAAAVAAPYWAGRLGAPPGAALRARQCSRRGGELESAVDGGRVRLVASAALLIAGELLLPAALAGGGAREM
jgi:predicted PhzF superfamily epimerase YddE/YHI9